jgi:DNA-binding SARP family transcriptional activator
MSALAASELTRLPEGGSSSLVDPAFRISLLNGFEARREGEPVEVPARCQRVLALLALHPGQVRRSFVAGTLWPDVTESRACSSLRSALWTLPRTEPPIVRIGPTTLALAPFVDVDLRHSTEVARRLADPTADVDDAELDERRFGADLLPEWSEDWILIQQQRYRELRLHALEALCDRLAACGRFGAAVQAGLAAVTAEPLRESAHGALMRAYMAEGNRSEAIRQFGRYARLVRDELGLDPSPEMESQLHAALRQGNA